MELLLRHHITKPGRLATSSTGHYCNEKRIPRSIGTNSVQLILININDSVFGKRVLMYWENRGNLNYHQMNVFMAAMENYTFLERGEPNLSENI